MRKEANIRGIASIQTDALYLDNVAVITGNVLKPLSKLFRLKGKSKRGICTLQNWLRLRYNCKAIEIDRRWD